MSAYQDIELPIDEEIAEALAGDIAEEALNEMWQRDQRRTLFGMLRQARSISTRLNEDERWLEMQRTEVFRKNEGARASLAFLEGQIHRLAETMLADKSKHVDVPGAGRIQYRDYRPSLHITDAEAFMAALDADERALMVETRDHLRTTEAKKYAEAVLETDGGVLLPGVEQVPERRVATIEYEVQL